MQKLLGSLTISLDFRHSGGLIDSLRPGVQVWHQLETPEGRKAWLAWAGTLNQGPDNGCSRQLAPTPTALHTPVRLFDIFSGKSVSRPKQGLINAVPASFISRLLASMQCFHCCDFFWIFLYNKGNGVTAIVFCPNEFRYERNWCLHRLSNKGYCSI